MSLGIVIKAAEGVVLAAESRVTFFFGGSPLTFDTVTKLFTFQHPHNYVGVVTFGAATMGERTAQSLMPEFEASLGNARLKVAEYASRLSDFFSGQHSSWVSELQKAGGQVPPDHPDMHFVLGGFDEGEPYGTMFSFAIPNDPTPKEFANEKTCGIRWGGQRDVVDRLLLGYDPELLPIIQRSLSLTDAQIRQVRKELEVLQKVIPFEIFGLQDAIDVAVMFIRTTIESQRLTIDLRGCGGPIEVGVITRTGGFSYVQRKALRGET
ncbi:MAG: hypothetical protein AMXMBFR56_56930 [Polyangiaceae bacterium]